MLNSELAFLAKDIVLDVRSFSVEEALSEPFEALITARSTSSDVDLDAIVGYGAAFRLAAVTSLTSSRSPYRAWSGICSHAEQVRVEPDGVSTYLLRIVPMFWRTTQRRNHRIFQHVTVPDIVTEVLGGYGIDPEFRLDPSAYPRHEYRVQYGETDFAFISRLLEEAGISYLFEQVDAREEGQLETMKVVLVDRPGEAKLRKGDPIPFVGDTEQWPEGPFVSNVRFTRQLRPGRFTIRDYDFRSSPDLRLLASVRTRVAAEERYEMYHYAPGSFLCEPRRSRRGGDGAKVDEQLGQARAEVGLDAVRSGRRTLSFRSNVADLHPGSVFCMSGYPRREIEDKTPLLLVRRTIEGDVEELTDTLAQAVLAGDPYRPTRHTPKPRMSGIQSAIVVGPKGEEIYTDEYGRVRVQFHWDREGKQDEHSSCWIRVTQAWAGSGWGITSIPRIGTEVLVDFLEGDPDLPVIIGAVHNTACRTPYRLPDNKTKTVWKSATSPGAGGSNEITFEDARGEENIYVHAQRNLEQKVEADETRTTGANLNAVVVKNEQREIQGDQSIVVKGDRKVSNSGRTSENASQGLAMGSGASTGVACQPGAVTMTSGQTSVMLDGPNVYIDCAGNLQIAAGRTLTLSGKQVRITGDPEVFINCHDAVSPNVRSMPAFFAGPPAREARGRERPDRGRTRRGDGRPEDPGRAREVDVVNMRGRRREEMPDRVRVPRATNEQLRSQGRRANRSGRLVDALTYESMKRNVDRRLQFERRRLERLDRDLQRTFERQRYHVEGLVEDLGVRLGEEKQNLSDFFGEVGDVFSGEAGGFKESCGALYDAFREQARNIVNLRRDIVDLIRAEREIFKGFAEDWQELGDAAAGIFDDFKNVVEDPGDAISDWLFGDQGDTFEPVFDDLFGDTPDVPPNVPDGGRPPRPPGPGDGGGPPAPGDVNVDPNRAGRSGGTPGRRKPMRASKVADSGSGGMRDAAGRGQRIDGQGSGKSFRDAGRRGQSVGGQGSGKSFRDAGRRGQSVGGQGGKSFRDAGREGVSTRGRGMKEIGADRAAQRVQTQEMSGSSNAFQGVSAEDLGGQRHAVASGTPSGANLGGAQGLSQASGASAGPGGVDLGGAGGLQRAGSSGAAGGFEQASGNLASAAGGPSPSQSAGVSVSRAGALGPADVSSTVSPDDVAFLQSPGDGQLMVVPSDTAKPISEAAFTTSVVDAQMAGRSQGAMAQALSDSGYVVYERGTGDWFGEFVKAAASQAG